MGSKLQIYESTSASTPAAMFAWMIPHISQIARQFGYAIAVHGSMNRDLDLIAVPWIKEASPPETLVEAICSSVAGFIRNDPQTELNQYNDQTRNPNDKPHGRRAWSIYFSGHRFYIDLSVMPLKEPPHA